MIVTTGAGIRYNYCVMWSHIAQVWHQKSFKLKEKKSSVCENSFKNMAVSTFNIMIEPNKSKSSQKYNTKACLPLCSKTLYLYSGNFCWVMHHVLPQYNAYSGNLPWHASLLIICSTIYNPYLANLAGPHTNLSLNWNWFWETCM